MDNVSTTPVIYDVHTDHLMRPILLTTQAGGVVWSAAYAPSGSPTAITGTPVLNLRAPGQWYQLETQLHYKWHRHYDPSLERHIQPDPLGLTALLSDGPSVYGYVGGSRSVR